MKTIKNIILILVASFLMLAAFYSCTYRLDITTGEGEPRLVVYGYITTEAKQHYIHIHRSTGYFATEKPKGVSNAMVTITTDDNRFELLESPTEPGLYWTQDDVYGIEGKTYTLNVLADFKEDGIMEEYEATSYLPYKPRVDSIEVRKSKALSDHMEVVMWGRIPDNDVNYMSFHVYNGDKLMNDSLTNFSLIDDEYIDGKEIKAVPCMFFDQKEEDHRYEILPGDSITLRVDVLTEEYGKFIENAQQEVWGSIPIFSGPPANIPSNVKAKDKSNKTPISGFFSAYGGEWKSTIYTPKEKK